VEVQYLSPEWFAAAAAALENDDRLRELTADLELTIEQTVTEGPDLAGPPARPGAVTQWHIVLDHGSTRLVVGPAPHADLRFRASYAVAGAIARGELPAPIAFVRGELTVGGNLNLLTTHQRALGAVNDVLHEVRDATTFA
jgi:SCP-2 sterol transfer family